MSPSTDTSAHSVEHDAKHAQPTSNQSSQISDSDIHMPEAEGMEEEEEEEDYDDEKEEKEEEEVDEEEEEAAGAEQETDPAEEHKEKQNDTSDNSPTIHQEESFVSCGDARDHKSGKHFVAAGENKTLESAASEMDAKASMNKEPKEISQAHGDSKDYWQNTEISVADTLNPSTIMEKELTTASCMKRCSILDSKNEVEPMNLQAENDRKQISSRFSRLVASKIRTRSPSPSIEFKNGSKRPAVLCDFFAKGWCIKGTSCSFLHQNWKADGTSLQIEGDITAAYSTTEEQLEGLRDNMGKSKLPGYPEPMTFFEASPPLEDGERQRLNQLDEGHKFSLSQGEDLSSGVFPASQRLSSSKWDPVFSSFKDGVGYQGAPNNCGRCSSPITSSNSPLFWHSLVPDHRSSSTGVAVTSSNYCSVNPFSHSSSLDVLTGIRNQYMHSSNLDGSLSSSGTLPSHHVSVCLGSFSLNYSQNVSDSDIDHLVSSSPLFLQCASFCSSEPQRLPRTSRSLDRYAENKKKILPDDWEPSVPFQPSFFITPTTISSPGGQYDPLRDSVDTPYIRGKSFTFSFISQVASVLNTSHHPMSGDSLVSQSFSSKYNGHKRTPSSTNIFLGSNKDSNTPGKGSFTTGKLTGESVIDGRIGVMLEEENASDTSCVRHSSNNNKNDAASNSRHQVDGSRCKKDSKANRIGSKIEMEVDQGINADSQKDSKALRHFRAALVDYVKELLKPTWREGHLSKDAHNTIVKKTVDKVISTMQSHQVPPTLESTSQYLSLSRPKLTKLLEAYITKYGKS